MVLDLEADIKANAAFIVALDDMSVANRVYSALTAYTWYKVRSRECSEEEQVMQLLVIDVHNTARQWSCDYEKAGHILADIRNDHYDHGNDYYDWFAHYATYEPHTPEIIQMFQDIDWIPVR